MIRTIFILEDLRQRELEHRTNAARGRPEQGEQEQKYYINMQTAMADVYAELIAYRMADSSFFEEEGF